MKTIYKIDSKNKTRIINFWTEDNIFYTEAGILGGKLVKNFTICEGKNIGKINESTPEQQAILEMEADIKKKLKGEYYENIDDITLKEFRPMKGLVWEDQKIKPEYPLLASYKLDGARCYAELIDGKVILKSFTGEVWLNCEHISESLLPLLNRYPNLIIDGEFYNMKYAGRFNELMSIIRQQTPTIAEKELSESVIQLHIYDIYDKNFPLLSAFDRYATIIHLSTMFNKYVIKCNQKIVRSDIEFNNFHKEATDLGCEGSIVRTNIAYTPNKKGKGFYKRKDYQDAEFELIDLLEGEGKWIGKAKKAIVKMPNGKHCGVGVIGSYEVCEEYLKNKDFYIGKLATVKYLCFTPDGLLREGILKDINRPD